MRLQGRSAKARKILLALKDIEEEALAEEAPNEPVYSRTISRKIEEKDGSRINASTISLITRNELLTQVREYRDKEGVYLFALKGGL